MHYEEGNEADVACRDVASFGHMECRVAAGERAWLLMLSHPSQFAADVIIDLSCHHVGHRIFVSHSRCLTDCEEDTKQGEGAPTTSLGIFSDSFSINVFVSRPRREDRGRSVLPLEPRSYS